MQIVTVRRTANFVAIVFDPHTTGVPIVLVPTPDAFAPRHYALIRTMAGDPPGTQRTIDDLLGSLVGRDCPDAALVMLEHLAAKPALAGGIGPQLLDLPLYAAIRDLLAARQRLGWPLAVIDLAMTPRPARKTRNTPPRQLRAAFERAERARFAA